MTENMVLLGATGSIGIQALDVAEKLHIRVAAMAAGSRVEPFEPLCRKFHPQAVAMMDEAAAKDLRVRLADTDIRVLSGLSGVCELAATPDADTVLNSVTGVAGLQPTLAAIETGHDVALANKETLVAGGQLVTKAVAEKKVKLLPVDSEHSAIFQCLQGKPANGGAARLILTASGGPFFGKTKTELETMKKEDALQHPNWSMGAKITIDSATMMNKGLELIEARWLFDMPADNIDIVVHRESVVHSLIEFADNSVLAQCGVPDMRIPIQYALTYPDRFPSPVKQLSLTDFGKLTFFEPDYETFPLMNVCRRAITIGGAAPAAVNGANEQAVALFLQDKIGFCDISRLVSSMLDRDWGNADSVEAILAADREARQLVQDAVV